MKKKQKILTTLRKSYFCLSPQLKEISGQQEVGEDLFFYIRLFRIPLPINKENSAIVHLAYRKYLNKNPRIIKF